MRISNTAIICLSSNSGGMEIDSIKLAKKLSPYTKIVLVAKKDKFIANNFDDYVGFNNISLDTINFKSSISPTIIFRMREIIQKHNIKNVIFFGASELKSLYFAFLGLEINLIIRHGTTKSTPKKDWFHKLIYSKVNYHVSISKHLQNNVKYIIPFGSNSKNILIYPSFIFSNIKQLKNDKLTLLHIGRIVNGKGQIDALLACEILFKNNIDFLLNIVGDFEEKDRNLFMQAYNSCKYKEKINLVGFSNNVQEYINGADIFIFPSYGEGFGNSFVEAILSKLVCLCYNNTTFPEFLALDFFFEMAKDRNINDLKSKLLNITNNLDFYKNKSSKNYQIAKKLFSTRREIEEYLNILK